MEVKFGVTHILTQDLPLIKSYSWSYVVSLSGTETFFRLNSSNQTRGLNCRYPLPLLLELPSISHLTSSISSSESLSFTYPGAAQPPIKLIFVVLIENQLPAHSIVMITMVFVEFIME
ncbi:MAG: hypothetical protein EZS28_047410 [Streblomastix strix]|uniref:Uncharacterized protein n=1 Tax=Streblomastix strix TaxID=222440 RepID=A0A5J4TF32_9EUKA|nr:MAG: hypothetical protein EZS28_047410 [Streblomastix strix]